MLTDFYDLETEMKEGEGLMGMLNPEKRTIFNAIINAIQGVDEALPKTFSVFFLIRSVRGLGEMLSPLHGMGLQILFWKETEQHFQNSSNRSPFWLILRVKFVITPKMKEF
ncbi:hypothetical protein AVEN_57450-1 [Araneus ventricosus]|uniref:Uncharacterized protein n=1 Tax=Araneus ventricosus TaxID=182803 RepID=A0A4Y2D042_ARAVE|nr:hypothetical protein AVEN_57450-1 [Araneus ventricosus]